MAFIFNIYLSVVVKNLKYTLISYFFNMNKLRQYITISRMLGKEENFKS